MHINNLVVLTLHKLWHHHHHDTFNIDWVHGMYNKKSFTFISIIDCQDPTIEFISRSSRVKRSLLLDQTLDEDNCYTLIRHQVYFFALSYIAKMFSNFVKRVDYTKYILEILLTLIPSITIWQRTMTNCFQGHRLITLYHRAYVLVILKRRLQDDEDLFAIDLFKEEIY